MKWLLSKKMKFTKNQKGLTLVELLAVIVILGVIAAIAVPSIGGVITSSKTKADAQTVLLLEDTVSRWAYDTSAAAGTINISTLVGAGYLKAVPKSSVDSAKSFSTATLTLTSGVYSVAIPAAV